MTILFKDIAQMGSAQLTLNQGWTATRVFKADKVPGNPDAIMYQAIIDGQVPTPGDLHPTIPLIIAQDLSASSIGANQVQITINYKAPSGGTTKPDEPGQTSISIGGTIKTVRTNKHVMAENRICLRKNTARSLHSSRV